MEDLSKVFNPRSIAVVGDKKIADYRWLRAVKEFKGKVFHVNVDKNEWPGAEALGFDNYASMLDIEEPVDYVIVSVPSQVAPRVLADCIKKGVGAVHMFTAGFDEAKTEEGDRLAAIIKQQAKEGSFHIIGPNCYGVFVPKIGLRQTPTQYVEEGGNVGFISQSGSQSMMFADASYQNGIKISKQVSYGNGIVLDVSDYLEYLGDDEETEAIGIFMEGTRDQERFFSILPKVAKKKPVLVWKVAQTVDGARAASNHSATRTMNPELWEVLVRRAGAINVHNMEELIDTLKVLLLAEIPQGNRMGLLASTGGHATEMTDTFAKAGLTILPLSEKSYERLGAFFNTVGGSYRNPIDGFGGDRANLSSLLEILGDDENIDAIHQGIWATQALLDSGGMDQLLTALGEFRQKSKKPLLITVPMFFPYPNAEAVRELAKRLCEINIPIYPSYLRAATALNNAVEYYRHHSQ